MEKMPKFREEKLPDNRAITDFVRNALADMDCGRFDNAWLLPVFMDEFGLQDEQRPAPIESTVPYDVVRFSHPDVNDPAYPHVVMPQQTGIFSHD